jgi:hypothetical protein
VSLGTATVEVDPVGAVLQSDGKLVIVGVATFPTRGEFMIVRLARNGELDPSFADDGIAVIPVDPAGSAAFDAVPTPDGGLVVVGVAGATPRMAAIRLDRLGRRDGSFGDGGVFLSEKESEALGVARAADGSLCWPGRPSLRPATGRSPSRSSPPTASRTPRSALPAATVSPRQTLAVLGIAAARRLHGEAPDHRLHRSSRTESHKRSSS